MDANDRCDLCGAQAYASAKLPKVQSPLLFCAHHFAQYHDGLVLSGAALVDERHRVAEEEARRIAVPAESRS